MNPHVACGDGVLEKHLRRESCDLATDVARREDDAKLYATLIVIVCPSWQKGLWV